MTKKIKFTSELQQKTNSHNELEFKLKEAEGKIKSYVNDLQRLQAEFENYIKRSNKEKEKIKLIAQHQLIFKLLPLLGEFEKAINSMKESQGKESTNEGIKMIFNQLYKTLEEEGLKPIESIGKKHDPFLHEVIKIIDSREEEGIVLEEIQKGYLFNDNLLRPAKVIVSNGKNEQKMTSIKEKNE